MFPEGFISKKLVNGVSNQSQRSTEIMRNIGKEHQLGVSGCFQFMGKLFQLLLLLDKLLLLQNELFFLLRQLLLLRFQYLLLAGKFPVQTVLSAQRQPAGALTDYRTALPVAWRSGQDNDSSFRLASLFFRQGWQYAWSASA